jgi:hypothetical protein
MKKIAVVMLVFATSMFTKIMAQDHPAYLHALSDLRAARWMIDHRTGDWKAGEDEGAAVRKIDDAINEIKKASIDDHKNLNDHPEDKINDHKGRLTKALEYLRKARKDIEREEDNQGVKGLRERAYQHIDEAIRLTDKAARS